MTPITWQAAVDDEEQRPLLQDILEAAVDDRRQLTSKNSGEWRYTVRKFSGIQGPHNKTTDVDALSLETGGVYGRLFVGVIFCVTQLNAG